MMLIKSIFHVADFHKTHICSSCLSEDVWYRISTKSITKCKTGQGFIYAPK